jgi:hypothetical protein
MHDPADIRRRIDRLVTCVDRGADYDDCWQTAR